MWWYVVHSWHRSIGGTCFAVEKSFENSSWEVRAAAMLSPIHHHQHHGLHRHILIYCIGYYIVWGLAFTPCEPGARGTRWVAKRGWDCQTSRGALFFVIQLSQLRVVCYYWAQEPMGNCYGLLCLPVGQVVFSIWELTQDLLSISEYLWETRECGSPETDCWLSCLFDDCEYTCRNWCWLSHLCPRALSWVARCS